MPPSVVDLANRLSSQPVRVREIVWLLLTVLEGSD